MLRFVSWFNGLFIDSVSIVPFTVDIAHSDSLTVLDQSDPKFDIEYSKHSPAVSGQARCWSRGNLLALHVSGPWFDSDLSHHSFWGLILTFDIFPICMLPYISLYHSFRRFSGFLFTFNRTRYLFRLETRKCTV